MSDIAKDGLSFLPPGTARLAKALARPRLTAMASIFALAGLGWLYLGLAHADNGALFALICRPLSSPTTSDAAVIFAMWGAMVLAMMLPSAAPMILTYAEIADTAARKRIEVVSPLVLAAGYVTIWLAFALAAATLQLILNKAGLLDTAGGWSNRDIAAGLFLGAGLYQFSS